ncbi:MAG: hypothetical protein O3C60_18375 [Planctomycetota bacterium]|nr:hypothetical protein [Planctomycetota bacterium]
MARSSPPELPRAGQVAAYGLETFQFFAPVSLGILGALFGVVAVSGAALVVHSSGLANPKVDSVAATTAQGVAEPDVPSDQPAPTSPINETPATDIPEVAESAVPENAARPEPMEANAAAVPEAAGSLVPAADQQASTVNPKRPLDDVRSKAGILPITRIASEQKTVDLCSIVGVPALSIQLELVGNEFTDGKQLTLTKADANNDASSLWKVIQKPASALERPVELGQFEFSDERLSFLAAENSENSLLEFCLLRVSTADPPDTELCRLWKPLHLRDLAVTFENASTVYNLIPDDLPQLPANELRLAIETAGYGDCEFPAGKDLTFGNPVAVVVMDRRSKLFSTRFSLTTQDNRPLFVVSHFADVPQVTLRDDTPSIALSEQPLSTATLAALRRSGLKQQRDINKLIDSKTRLLSRVTTRTAERAVELELSTLTVTGSTLDELAAQVAALEEALEKIAGSGRTGLRLVRRINDEFEIVILETELFSEQQ